MFKSVTNSTYNYHALSAFDNPPVASSGMAHGVVAMLWNYSFDEHITRSQNIDSNLIIGSNALFPGGAHCLFQQFICHQLIIIQKSTMNILIFYGHYMTLFPKRSCASHGLL